MALSLCHRVAAGLALTASIASGLDNGLGLTPPMGYSTWNDYGCDGITAENIKSIADAMVAFGLDKLGYTYVNIDDCWAKERDPVTKVLQADKDAFPDGMKELADYVHSKGLKLGLYTDRGLWTCGTRPGSQGYEQLDAATFAYWGIDYLKEDSCNVENDSPDKAIKQFGQMRDALLATDRPIYFALCGWKPWYAPVGAQLANSWRISMDVSTWETVWYAAMTNQELTNYSGPGGWNDPDGLMGSSSGAKHTLSPEQVQTQFSLWAVMAAPLILGTRLLAISDSDLQVYSNADVIAVNQDPLGQQGRIVWEDCPKRDMRKILQDINQGDYPQIPLCQQIWARSLQGGDVALLLIDWAHGGRGDQMWNWMRVGEPLMQSLGFDHGARIRDLYAKQDVGVHKKFEVLVKADSASKLYRLSQPNLPGIFA